MSCVLTCFVMSSVLICYVNVLRCVVPYHYSAVVMHVVVMQWLFFLL